jgi:hypothetical protein
MKEQRLMIEQNPKVHHQTKRAAAIALAKRTISRASYDAVLAGTLSLQEAKAIGRDSAPATDTPEGSSGPGTATGTPRSARADTGAGRAGCLCGCGQTPRGRKSRFVQGHDHRLFGELKRNLEKDPLLRNERFTDEQKAYARERGLV